MLVDPSVIAVLIPGIGFVSRKGDVQFLKKTPGRILNVKPDSQGGGL